MDDISAQIAQILHDNGRATYRDISEMVDRSINAVRDRIIGMEKKGIIQGYQARISPVKQNHALAFLYRVEKGPQVDPNFWHSPRIAGAYAGPGRFPLVVHMQCGSLQKMAQFLAKGLYPSGYRIGVLDQINPPEPIPADAAQLSDDFPWPGVDLPDWKIIGQLRRNARAPIRSIAETLSLPETTVRDRVHKLEARGILRGVHATIQMAALGYPREALVIGRVPSSKRRDIVSALREQNTVLNAFSSSVRPDQIIIHAVSGSNRRLMDLLDESRVQDDLRVKHFQPIEKIYRHNPNDALPGRLIEEKVRVGATKATNPALENFVLLK